MSAHAAGIVAPASVESSDGATGKSLDASPTRPAWVERLVAAAPEVRWPPRPVVPDGTQARESAVLVLLAATPAVGPQTTPAASVVLLQRASTMRRHAGQIAFPGGVRDPDDTDASATALREATEEVGLQPDTLDVLTTLPPLYIPPSGYLVTPVLAYWRRPHPVTAVDAAEVAAVAVIDLRALAEPANRFAVHRPSGYLGPGFEVDGLFVWGFTAAVLDVVLELGGWARPWDRARRRGVDGTPVR